MEQDIKVGAAGSVAVTEAVAGESLKGSLPIGPLKISLDVEVDNAGLLALVAAKLPGGMAHDIAVNLQKVLFPVASSA